MNEARRGNCAAIFEQTQRGRATLPDRRATLPASRPHEQVEQRPTNDELEMWFVVELFVCHSVSFHSGLFSILYLSIQGVPTVIILAFY